MYWTSDNVIIMVSSVTLDKEGKQWVIIITVCQVSMTMMSMTRGGHQKKNAILRSST